MKTDSVVLANAENSGGKLEAIHAESSFAVTSIMHLSVQQLVRITLHKTTTNQLFIFVFILY